MSLRVVRISDEELVELAKDRGPRSIEARMVNDLRKRRAKDYQAYAFRVGDHYFTGPVQDARTEVAIIDLIAVAKWVDGEQYKGRAKVDCGPSRTHVAVAAPR